MGEGVHKMFMFPGSSRVVVVAGVPWVGRPWGMLGGAAAVGAPPQGARWQVCQVFYISLTGIYAEILKSTHI